MTTRTHEQTYIHTRTVQEDDREQRYSTSTGKPITSSEERFTAKEIETCFLTIDANGNGASASRR